MVSSLTTEGAEATLKALELGAVDFIPKQLSKVSLDIVRIENDLREKVKEVSKRRMLRTPRPVRPAPTASAPAQTAQVASAAPATAPSRPAMPATRASRPVRDVVAIGVSTGGPPAVQKVLSQLPADFPASILIAQHMPAAFTGAVRQKT